MRRLKYKKKYEEGVRVLNPEATAGLLTEQGDAMPSIGGMLPAQEGAPEPVEAPAKVVEAEEGETIFYKTPSGRYVLEKDLKGGKSHKEGGETIEVKEGSVIFPKNKREEVMDAYKTRDNLRLETIRLSLPEDKPRTPKYARGTKSIETIYDEMKGANMPDTSIGQMNYLEPYRSTPATVYASPSFPKTSGASIAQNVAENVVNLSPSLYNLGRGLFSKPETITRREYKPEEYEAFFDISPQLRDLRDAQTARVAAARNYSGGNVGAVLSNVNQAVTDTTKRLGDLRTQKFNIENSIRNRNVDTRNQAQMQNISLQNMYDDLEARNREARMAGIAQGLTGTSAYAQSRQNTRIMNEQARNRDLMLGRYNDMLASLAETANYKADFDANGNLIFKFKTTDRIVPPAESERIARKLSRSDAPKAPDILGVDNFLPKGESPFLNPIPGTAGPKILDVPAVSGSRTPSRVSQAAPKKNYTIDDLVDKVIQAESSRRPNVVSPKGAMGLMQVMRDTWNEWAPKVGAKDPNNPSDNKKVGTAYLKSLQKQFGGDVRLALIAYNWGPGNTRKWLRAGGNYADLPKETKNYLFKILGERVG